MTGHRLTRRWIHDAGTAALPPSLRRSRYLFPLALTPQTPFFQDKPQLGPEAADKRQNPLPTGAWHPPQASSATVKRRRRAQPAIPQSAPATPGERRKEGGRREKENAPSGATYLAARQGELLVLQAARGAGQESARHLLSGAKPGRNAEEEVNAVAAAMSVPPDGSAAATKRLKGGATARTGRVAEGGAAGPCDWKDGPEGPGGRPPGGGLGSGL